MHETPLLLIALLVSMGAVLIASDGRSLAVGLATLVAAAAVALFAYRNTGPRLPALGVSLGAAALLVVAFDTRDVAPGAAVASGAVALSLAMLIVASRLGRGLRASGVLLAAGAAELAQGVYFILGGSVVLVGPARSAEWYAVAVNATFIAAGAMLVVAELRRWRWSLAVAATVVTLNNVVLALIAIEASAWVAVVLHGLLIVFVVGGLWRRVTVSVGSRIMGGFGAVALFVVLLAAGLVVSLDRSADLDADRASQGLRLEISTLSVEVERVERAQLAYAVSGALGLYDRTLELGRDVIATGARMRAVTAGHALASPTDNFTRFLDRWVAELGPETTGRREALLQTGAPVELSPRFLAIAERVLALEIADRNIQEAADAAASQRAVGLQGFVLIGTVLLLAIAAMSAFFLARNIGRRMSVLTDAATSVASGRPYNGLIKLREGGDDLDALARTFERMRERLSTFAASEADHVAELDSVLDAVTRFAIIGSDLRGNITTFSRGAEQMLGWTAAEMVGAPALSDRFHDPIELEAAATLRPDAPPMAELFAAADPDLTLTQHWTYVRKDGSRLPAEVIITARRDGMGALIGFLAVARDLTNQNEAEEAMAAAARRGAELQSVLDAATEIGIMGVDTNGVLTTFNSGAEKMLGWSAAEMLGQPSPSPMLDAAEVAARAASLGIPVGPEVLLGRARTGVVDRQEWSYIRKDGSRLLVELTVSPRHDHDGNLSGFLGMARDLTAQRETEATLRAAKVVAEEADRAKSGFLADMSHELRTPLNAILGFSELLTEQLADTLNDRQKRFFSNIHVAGEHLLGLINDVLDLSKVEAGRLEIRPEIIEIGLLFEPTTVAARVAATQAGLTYECDSSATGLVCVDAARTRQVLFNLLSNAVKFTKAPGVVRLDVRFDGDALVIDVTDTGIGIAAADASKVFGIFERVNRERSSAPGTGLGLALTKRIVEQQGGTISFESVAGQGTTFTVTLHDARYEDTRTDAILIVEDNWADAELLAALAGAEGLSTERVATLADATEALRRGRPLAVMLDLFLPDGHGASILEAVKSSPETADVPVLVVTSTAETARFRLMGAECMTKPIDPAAVRAWLRRVAPRLVPSVAA